MAEVDFGGQQFRTAESIALMPLMRFAKVAQGGTDSNDMGGLAAIYDLLKACIHADDWSRFEQVATDTAADGETLMAVVPKVMEALAERPTSQPSDSSAGQPRTAPTLQAVSSLRDTPIPSDRPDLQRLRDQLRTG